MRTPSYTPDMAAQIDTLEDDLVEAFAAAVNRVALVLPNTERDFRSMVVAIFRTCFEGIEENVQRPTPNPVNKTGQAAQRPTVGEVLARYLEKEVAAARSETAVRVIELIMDGKAKGLTKADILSADSLAFAAGLHGLQEGQSQVELGEKNGVGRAAVSRRVTKYHRDLNLHPSRGSKSPAAVEKYRKRELAKKS